MVCGDCVGEPGRALILKMVSLSVPVAVGSRWRALLVSNYVGLAGHY